MPADDTAERSHHLRQLHKLAEDINAHGGVRRGRVAELRQFYERAIQDFDALITALPQRTLNANHRRRWVDEPYAALEAYAVAERLW